MTDFSKTLAALARRGYEATAVATKEEAAALVLKEAEQAQSVGWGSSESVKALPLARKACRILPAGLGERVGDFAALAIALSAADARPLVGKRLPSVSSCFLESY